MKKTILILSLGILLITGCVRVTPPATVAETQTSSRTPTLTRTPKPTKTPTITHSPTSTVQPPLVEHEWSPETLLIYFDVYPGIGYIFPSAPFFILYADGRLFIKVENETTNREQIFAKHLSRQETCQMLNTLDQIGYLDYDPQNYYQDSQAYNITDAGDYIINVNAWKNTLGNYYALGEHLYFLSDVSNEKSEEFQKYSPVILPALRDTFYFLRKFPHSDFELYSPEKLLIWVSLIPQYKDDSTGKQWTLKNLSLAQLHQETGSNVGFPPSENSQSFAILEDDDADAVFELFQRSYDAQGELYVQDGQGYVVFTRPLLPYEDPHLYISQYPPSNSSKPDFKLHCYPSDGTLPIPTSFYP